MSFLICASSRCHIIPDRMIEQSGLFFCYFVCIKWDNSFWGSFLFLNWKGRGVWGKESALEQVHNDNFSVSLKSSTELYIDKHWLMGPGTSHCIQCVCRLCVNSTLVCLFREVYWFLMTNLRIQCSIFFFRKLHHPVNHHSLFTNLFAGIYRNLLKKENICEY